MIQIKKFGGKILADCNNIKKVTQEIAAEARLDRKIVVVVSAFAGKTDELINVSREITENPCRREYDALLACGEQISASLFAMGLMAAGCPAKSYAGWQAGILTDQEGTIVSMNTRLIHSDLTKGKVVVVTGFQGIDAENNVVTLGRGGSDITAVALAHFLKAKHCEIYKDTGGIYSSDPKINPGSNLLPTISYDEIIRISESEERPMQARAIKLAQKHNIAIHIMNSFDGSCGTVIGGHQPSQSVNTLERNFFSLR